MQCILVHVGTTRAAVWAGQTQKIIMNTDWTSTWKMQDNRILFVIYNLSLFKKPHLVHLGLMFGIMCYLKSNIHMEVQVKWHDSTEAASHTATERNVWLNHGEIAAQTYVLCFQMLFTQFHTFTPECCQVQPLYTAGGWAAPLKNSCGVETVETFMVMKHYETLHFLSFKLRCFNLVSSSALWSSAFCFLKLKRNSMTVYCSESLFVFMLCSDRLYT